MHISPLDLSDTLAPKVRVEVIAYRLLADSIRPVFAVLDKFQMGGGGFRKVFVCPIRAVLLATPLQVPPRPSLALVLGQIGDLHPFGLALYCWD